MCLGEVARVIDADADAGTATLDGVRTTTALLVALDDGGASLQPGDWVLVHLGIVTEVLDEATASDLVAHRDAVTAAAAPIPPPSNPAPSEEVVP